MCFEDGSLRPTAGADLGKSKFHQKNIYDLANVDSLSLV